MMKQEHNKTKNGLNNGLQIKIQLLKSLTLPENLTILDLSGRQLERIEIDVLLPNLINLNLSHNNLKEVPGVVLRLNKLKTFDLSFNSIELFDDEPAFCDSIELLNVSNNALIGPPYWIWSKSTGNLHHLNLSNNRFLLTSLKNEYLEEFLTYSLSVTEIHLQNCGLKDTSSKILSTLQRAKKLTLGSLDYNYLSTNHLIELPCEGLDTLCDIESLNVCNSHIYTVNCNISIYKNLIEIDLSDNWIHSLPNEFSLLKNLEICTLSKNKLLYLPENIQELVKLKALYLNCNELCMIEENLCKLHCLSILDLYDNFITGVPEDLKEKLEAIDLAQNYFDEPEDICYVDKKQKLRLNKEPRNNGRYIFILPAYINNYNQLKIFNKCRQRILTLTFI